MNIIVASLVIALAAGSAHAGTDVLSQLKSLAGDQSMVVVPVAAAIEPAPAAGAGAVLDQQLIGSWRLLAIESRMNGRTIESYPTRPGAGGFEFAAGGSFSGVDFNGQAQSGQWRIENGKLVLSSAQIPQAMKFDVTLNGNKLELTVQKLTFVLTNKL